MRTFGSLMRRFGDLQQQLELLSNLTREELLQRAMSLERRNFELENILKKWSDDTECQEIKKRPFDFSKYKKRHIALQFAYLGWDYSGLAMQKSYPKTIMQKLLESMEKCRLIEDASSHQFAVCGRTDKGVSAVGQVVSTTVRSVLLSGTGIVEDSGSSSCERKEIPSQELDYVFLLNRVLPHDIRVIAWSPVTPDFNARFSCTQRAYSYFFPLSGLNIEAMREAACRLEGTHDFRNFCSSPVDEGVTGFVRRIDRVEVHFSDAEDSVLARNIHSMIQIDVKASGFLYHQIRCMVSILVMIGRGLEAPQLIDEMLNLSQTPAKPQYQMAGELPLLFTGATYPNDAVEWQTSQAAQADLLRHFQQLWSEHAIRSTTVRNILDHIETRFPMNPQPCHQLDRIIPECRWRQNSSGKGGHKPLAKRPVELTINEKQERAKRKRCHSLIVGDMTSSDEVFPESVNNDN